MLIPRPLVAALHVLSENPGISKIPGFWQSQFPFTDPVGVEGFFPRFVNALISMCTEVVPLRLQQIGRQSILPVTVVITQGRREAGDGQPEIDRCGNHPSPTRLGFLDGLLEKVIQ